LRISCSARSAWTLVVRPRPTRSRMEFAAAWRSLLLLAVAISRARVEMADCARRASWESRLLSGILSPFARGTGEAEAVEVVREGALRLHLVEPVLSVLVAVEGLGGGDVLAGVG